MSDWKVWNNKDYKIPEIQLAGSNCNWYDTPNGDQAYQKWIYLT